MMTIAENIGYGLRRRGMAKGEIARKVDEALDPDPEPQAGARLLTLTAGAV